MICIEILHQPNLELNWGFTQLTMNQIEILHQTDLEPSWAFTRVELKN